MLENVECLHCGWEGCEDKLVDLGYELVATWRCPDCHGYHWVYKNGEDDDG